jgi:hypothetical protein
VGSAIPFEVPTDTWGQGNNIEYCDMDGAFNKLICWSPIPLLGKDGACFGIATLNLRWYVLQRTNTFLPRLRDLYNNWVPSSSKIYTAGVAQDLTNLENKIATVITWLDNKLLQPSGVCSNMKHAIGSGSPGMVIIRGTYVEDGKTKNGGHALVGFAYEETADEVQFTVADPNSPDEAQLLIFNKSNFNWSYPADPTWLTIKIGFLDISHFGTAPSSPQNADLLLTTFGQFSPAIIAPGAHPTALSFYVKNLGPMAVSSPNTLVVADFFLSTNATFGDGDDIKIGEIGFDLNLSVNQTALISLTQTGLQYIEIPPNVMRGQYYLFVRVRHSPPSELIDPAPYNDQIAYSTRIAVQDGLIGLSINGPSSVNESSSATYTATASWSNGTTSTVTPSWSENSSYATISSSGVLNTSSVSSNQSMTIMASYTYGGVTKTAMKAVTIVDLVSATINITSPVTGEVWDEKTYHWIQWDTSENVKVEYSVDGGAGWVTIVSSIVGGRHYWQVPQVSSSFTNCYIRITSNVTSAKTGKSGRFTIRNL